MTDDDVRELRSALKLVQRRLRREVVPRHGLSRSALQALAALARGTGSPGELAIELQMTTSNVAAALRELDDAGHVERTPDPVDRRRTRVTVTTDGRRAIDELRSERDTWLGRAIAAELGAEERDVLRRAARLLVRVAAHDDDVAPAARR